MAEERTIGLRFFTEGQAQDYRSGRQATLERRPPKWELLGDQTALKILNLEQITSDQTIPSGRSLL
ncbi:MAG TPA: hypothetical protein VH353_04710 [Caulobacteraceae bacterium]|jgi:hypothetical protein|nr:hypothetical protein [Caulobacteraceae bacterium]